MFSDLLFDGPVLTGSATLSDSERQIDGDSFGPWFTSYIDPCEAVMVAMTPATFFANKLV